MIEKNVITDFSPEVSEPTIGEGCYIHPLASGNRQCYFRTQRHGRADCMRARR